MTREPRIFTLSQCRNEAHLAPFFLRHYSRFAQRMVIWDDKSDDGTREILAAHPQVDLREWPHDNGLDDHYAHDFWYRTFQQFTGLADWLILVDMDEFVMADFAWDFAANDGWDALRTIGFNMVGREFPKDDGKSQIWELHTTGVYAPSYSKTIILRPDTTIRWKYGRHELQQCPARIREDPQFKLLHYRFMGRDYTAWRNARNYERCGLKSGNKEFAWTCDAGWHGEHSADWAERQIADAFDVVKFPMADYPHKPHDLNPTE